MSDPIPGPGNGQTLLSPAQRDTAWNRLGAEQFDVIVIGGGVVGAGAALDAATRGLKVALVEARDFAIAARMLDLLAIPRIRLMTNNPEKVARLEKEGVEVVERIPLALPTNRFNEQYLATKRDRTGHQF